MEAVAFISMEPMLPKGIVGVKLAGFNVVVVVDVDVVVETEPSLITY